MVREVNVPEELRPYAESPEYADGLIDLDVSTLLPKGGQPTAAATAKPVGTTLPPAFRALSVDDLTTPGEL